MIPPLGPLNTASIQTQALQQLAELLGTPADGSPQFQSFIDAIPYANDGDVIRADHFNAIRGALVQLATALGLSRRPIGVDVLTIFPTQSGGVTEPWEQHNDRITAPPTAAPEASLATTFIPVILPDGVDILSLGAAGEQSSASTVYMRLQRRQLTTDPEIDPIDKIVSYIPRESGRFNDKAVAQDNVRIPGLRRVDNKLFSYFIRVTWSDAGPKPKSAEVYGFQIAYART
jgi:hypothetical protein